MQVGVETVYPEVERDSPLTDVTVHAQAQVAGTTQSSISCVDSAGHSVGSAPSSATTADNITANAHALTPGTYTCTVVIDP